jgi:hypothetical protein
MPGGVCRVVLSQVVLSQVVLSQVVLSQVVLSQVVLSQVVLSQVVLSQVVLRRLMYQVCSAMQALPDLVPKTINILISLSNQQESMTECIRVSEGRLRVL